MSYTIIGFDGRAIVGSRSVGSGVFAAFDWHDMVLNPGPPIIRKALTERGRTSDFPPEDRETLKAKLGHYSRLQSANSEDTVTWSVFGAKPFAPWLTPLLAGIFDEPTIPSDWSACFWQRQAHPDTGLVEHGPESEITLTAPGWCIEIEAKWLSDLDGTQGAARNRSQIDMRAFTAQRNAGSGGAWRVLVIAPSVGLYPPAGKQASVFRTYFDQDGASYRGRASAEDAKARVVTWEEVAAVLATHAGYKEIADYLRWRLTLIDGKGNRRPGSPAPAK